MKEIFQKIAHVCKLVFGYGIMITLFLGGLTFFGYVIALIVGGDTAAAICKFLYKTLIPIITYATSSLVLFGLVAMYFAGEKALTPEKPQKQK